MTSLHILQSWNTDLTSYICEFMYVTVLIFLTCFSSWRRLLHSNPSIFVISGNSKLGCCCFTSARRLLINLTYLHKHINNQWFPPNKKKSFGTKFRLEKGSYIKRKYCLQIENYLCNASRKYSITTKWDILLHSKTL